MKLNSIFQPKGFHSAVSRGKKSCMNNSTHLCQHEKHQINFANFVLLTRAPKKNKIYGNHIVELLMLPWRAPDLSLLFRASEKDRIISQFSTDRCAFSYQVRSLASICFMLFQTMCVCGWIFREKLTELSSPVFEFIYSVG